MSVLGPLTILTYGPADPETGEREITGTVPGSHYNIARSDLTEALTPYEVDPEPMTPAVIWAGDEIDPETGRWRETAFLRFDTETEAQTALGIEP